METTQQKPAYMALSGFFVSFFPYTLTTCRHTLNKQPHIWGIPCELPESQNVFMFSRALFIQDFIPVFITQSSLPRRRPDILHLRRLVQKLVAFALLAIHPIARQAVADPRPLHVHGKLLELLQKPNHIHQVIRRNAFQQLCHPPFQLALRNFV